MPFREKMLCLVFFASGASGLLFETLWFYQSGLALGNSYWAASVVLAAFMGGLAIGNLVAVRMSKSMINVVITYALMEFIIAIAGPSLVFLLPSIGKFIAPLFGQFLDQPTLVNPLRFITALIALLIPSTAMGMTLPLLTRALSEGEPRFGEILGKLYGLNTIGAVVGVMAGELLLIQYIGIWGTAVVAALLNVAAAIVAGSMSSQFSSAVPNKGEVPKDSLFPPSLAPYWLSIALGGFLLLALEVIWIRFLSLFVFTDSLAFATMLTVVLAGIASGGLVASSFLRRQAWASSSSCTVLFIAGALCSLTYALFPLYYRPFEMVPIVTMKQILWISVPLIFPVAFFSGAFFTLAGAKIRSSFHSSQVAAGMLTFVNTVGAALGSIVAGFLLIPRMGMELSFFLLTLCYGCAGMVWWMRAKEPRKYLYAGVVPWLVCLVLFPFGTMQNRHIPISASHWSGSGNGKLVSIREGLTETLMYLEFRKFNQTAFYRVITNSFSMASNDFGARRYMKQFAYWPLALHPNPKSALLICFGVGSTAKALTDSRALESIDVVDISNDILDMSRIIFPNPADNPLKDPRVRVHVEDGRYFLQASLKKFDLVTGEPPPPTLAGVASLYTREYFQLIHDHLAEGGMTTYWLPIHDLSEEATLSILRGFAEVFKTSFLWHGSQSDLMMIGIREPINPASAMNLEDQWRIPKIAAEIATLGFETPAQLAAGFIGDGNYIRQLTQRTPPLTDNFPKRIVSGGADDQRLYNIWLDTNAAKERFRNSPDIQQLWPSTWLTKSLPYFDTTKVLTTLGASARSNGFFPDFHEIHQLITTTPLKTPILWIMGSSKDEQRLIANLAPEARRDPIIQYHLGIQLLAERSYKEAAIPLKYFLATKIGSQVRMVSTAAYLYTLCMANLTKEANAYIEEVKELPETRAIPPSYWVFMKNTFGLSIPVNSIKQQSSSSPG